MSWMTRAGWVQALILAGVVIFSWLIPEMIGVDSDTSVWVFLGIGAGVGVIALISRDWASWKQKVPSSTLGLAAGWGVSIAVIALGMTDNFLTREEVAILLTFLFLMWAIAIFLLSALVQAMAGLASSGLPQADQP